MQHTPSRKEKRESKFLCLAKQGKMSCTDCNLFKKEAESLNKHGFIVFQKGFDARKPLPSIVSWGDAYKNGIPLSVSDYFSGKTDIFPEVSNLAQKLYVIAARGNYRKAHNE